MLSGSVLAWILLVQSVYCFVSPRFHRFVSKPSMSTSPAVESLNAPPVAIDVSHIEWFQKLQQTPEASMLDIPEWRDEEWRSADGFKGRDFCHSPSAAVRIVDYLLLPATVKDPEGVTTECFPKLVGPAHFTQRAESHRGTNRSSVLSFWYAAVPNLQTPCWALYVHVSLTCAPIHTVHVFQYTGLCHGGSFCALMDDAIGWMGFCVSGAVKPWSGYTVQVCRCFSILIRYFTDEKRLCP